MIASINCYWTKSIKFSSPLNCAKEIVPFEMKEIYVFWLSPLFYLLPIAHLSRSWPRGIQRQTHLHSRSPKKSRFKIHHTSDDGSSHKPWHTALPCINWHYRLKVSASVLVSAIPTWYWLILKCAVWHSAMNYTMTKGGKRTGRETKTFKVKQEVTDWDILENVAFS